MKVHCILFYDVKIKRISRFHRVMRRNLFWTQNSSFEGDLALHEQTCLRNDIYRLLDPTEDSVLMIWTPTSEAWEKIVLGKDKGRLDLIA